MIINRKLPLPHIIPLITITRSTVKDHFQNLINKLSTKYLGIFSFTTNYSRSNVNDCC